MIKLIHIGLDVVSVLNDALTAWEGKKEREADKGEGDPCAAIRAKYGVPAYVGGRVIVYYSATWQREGRIVDVAGTMLVIAFDSSYNRHPWCFSPHKRITYMNTDTMGGVRCY